MTSHPPRASIFRLTRTRARHVKRINGWRNAVEEFTSSGLVSLFFLSPQGPRRHAASRPHQLESKVTTEQGPQLVALFVRHGQTELNKEKRFRGQMDVPLDAVGRQQAIDIRSFLASHLGDKQLGASFRSSKDRARVTADIVMGPGKTKPVKNFDALNVGKFSGQLKSPENMKEIMHYQKYPDQKIPGGERVNDFRERTDPEIKMVIAEGERSGRPSIVICHSSTIHEVSHLFHHDHNAVKVTPGGIVAVYKRPSGSYYAAALLHESRANLDNQMMS